MTEKEPMPDKMRALAVAARSRLQKLPMSAPLGEIWARPEDGGRDYLACPWSEDDWELWASLLLDTFGTRYLAVAQAFMRQLGEFCPEIFDPEQRCHILDGELFQQALSIVRSLKPRNEAEAAIAVQAVAVHFCAMKVSNHIEDRSFLDARVAGSLAKLSKAFTGQVESLQQMRSGGKAKRQVIKVEKNVNITHYHDERHVHLPGEGGQENGGQPYAPNAQRARARSAGEPIELAALPSPDKEGEALLRPCGEGQAGLPDARRRKRIGSTEGEGQRQLSPRRIHG